MNNTTSHNNRRISFAILGTGSDVGKSTIAAGICRILTNGGLKVAPFKAQNMSNNAHVALSDLSPSGYGEIGVAQVVQAQACRRLACVEMNPILLKSGGRRESDGAYLCSVIVRGQPVGATAMATPFRRWTTCRARKEKTNSTLALAQASEPRVSLLFSPPGPSMV